MKRFLFFVVHPAKFHLFRGAINELVRRGHAVDVAISSKEMLEELIQKEGWSYANLFPRGRRLRYLHPYLNAAVGAARTVFKLLRFTRGKHYDLYITDDLLTIVGRLKGVPSLFVTDDDVTAVPESQLLAWTASEIVAPAICRMGRFSGKQLGYNGYKALAHLHPARFSPDRAKLEPAFRDASYFFFRLVSATSTHDVGKTGITDALARRLVEMLRPHGQILISSQRPLPLDLAPFQVPLNTAHAAHYLSFAELVVSDSTTMCAEAAVLGTPTIEIDDWHADFRQYEELHGQYRLLQGFFPNDEERIFQAISELLSMPDRRKIFEARRQNLLRDKVDVTAFLIWLFENYPASAQNLKGLSASLRPAADA